MVKKRIHLIDMKKNEKGIIVDIISCGENMCNRLKSMGIRVGIKLTRVNSNFGRGPIIIKIGERQTALGYGMSCKIIVEVEQ